MSKTTTAVILSTLLAFLGCSPQLTPLHRDHARLKVALASCTAEGDMLREGLKQCQVESEAEIAELEHQTQVVCDNFEEESKARLVATVADLTLNTPMLSSCSEGLSIQVRKIETSSAYLKYTVKGQVRYSDALVWEGKKSDRSSLYIRDGLDHPVLVTVGSCDADSCLVECTAIHTQGLSCSNPDIKPEIF